MEQKVTVVRKGSASTVKPLAELTGAQRHKRHAADAMLQLNKRIEDSPLWDHIPRSRRSWCARLRELELHPERVGAIRARVPKAYRDSNAGQS